MLDYWGEDCLALCKEIMEKSDVKPEELGSLLFSYAAQWASRDSETAGFLESVGTTSIDRQELLIMIMYAAVNVVLAKIAPEDKAYRVLDAMFDAFVNQWKPEVRKQVRMYVGMRHGEYAEALEEKRGPNPLWPLSHHLLKNILGKETIGETPLDSIRMSFLADYYTTTSKLIIEIVGDVQIV